MENMEIEKQSFTFFPSYRIAIEKMSDSQLREFINGLCDIADGHENVPENAPDPAVSIALAMAEPNVSKSVSLRQRGRKGGKSTKNDTACKPTDSACKPTDSACKPTDSACKPTDSAFSQRLRGIGEGIGIGIGEGEGIGNSLCDSSGFGIEEEFEVLWEKYPKKAGKQIALSSYAKARAEDGVKFDDVKEGIEAYKRHIESMGINIKFVMSGSRFFTERRWEDEYGTNSVEEDDDTYF